VVIDASELGMIGELFTAGSRVPPGRYRRVDGSPREFVFPAGGVLPPSFDGQVALYMPVAESVKLTTVSGFGT
jgi:hypothetical protein